MNYIVHYYYLNIMIWGGSTKYNNVLLYTKLGEMVRN